jgi:hypothetical protein
MPSVYQTLFGGNPVAPAIPTYLALSFSVNTVLGWPLESNIASPAVAEWIDCTATVGALTLQLSDARQVSTGYTAIFNNVGGNTFSVLDAAGNTLMAPASGTAWILVLADNSTLAGTWRALQLGAGTSVANAAALAGNGLKAITTTLNERIFINAQGTNYTILTADRANCVEWTGGSGGTFTLTAAGTLGSDWFCYIKNSGTGVLTLSPPTGTIDGTSNKTFNPGDSCIVISDGATFFTIGFGQAVASSFNFVTISLAAASGTVILSGAQLNRISYKFTGALAGNTVVQVPASIQQYWVDNETTGAFTLTISAGGAGTTFTVPQANRTILYCDGLNIVNAISSGAIQFADGTAAAPSITFASDTTLGFYKAGADVLGISTAGVQRGVINAGGQWTINAPTSGVALAVTAVATATAISAVGSGAGVEVVQINDTAGDARVGMYSAGTEYGLIQVTANAFNLSGVGASTVINVSTNGNVRATVSATGNVTVNAPTSGTTVTVTGAANANSLAVTSPNTASQSFGASITAGTNSTDYGILSQSASGIPLFKVRGDGVVLLLAGTQPAFNVQRISTGQTLAATVIATVIYNSANTNQGTNYNTGTGTFTAPVAGVYAFAANATVAAAGGGTGIAVNAFYFSKNSNSTVGPNRYDFSNLQQGINVGSGVTIGASGSVVIALAASDTIAVKADIGASGGGTTLTLAVGSFFSGYLLG